MSEYDAIPGLPDSPLKTLPPLPPVPPPALELRNITVRAGKSTLLGGVGLSLAARTVTGIIGPNGAGKSTLISVAAGTRRPDSGQVLLHGTDLREFSAHALAGIRAVMSQATTVAFPFTVRQVVAMGRIAQDPDESTITEIALQTTGLTALAERTATTLSGGELQRVALARVLAQVTPLTEGTVILFDEPTSAMDIGHAEATLELARSLARRGAAVGIALHDLDSAAHYADRLVLLAGGHVRAAGTVDEVCRAELLSEVYQTPIEVYEHGGRRAVRPVRGSSQ